MDRPAPVSLALSVGPPGSSFVMNAIETIEKRQLRKGLPRFKAGDTVRVHFRVIEGTRSRVQVFEGIVIKRQGAGVRETFTVRKQSFGVGVERTFPLHSPKIEKIEVVQIGDVSRAKLYYLREKVGKKARVRAKQYGGKVFSADVDEAAEEAPEEAPEAEVEAVEEPVAEQPEAAADVEPEPEAEPEPKTRRRRGGRARDFLASTGGIGARYVVGADEAGRGSLAGPLLVAGVLLDYDALRGSRVRPLALLNDSKQLTRRAARGAVPGRRRLRRADQRPGVLAGEHRPRRPSRLQPPRPARRASMR